MRLTEKASEQRRDDDLDEVRAGLGERPLELRGEVLGRLGPLGWHAQPAGDATKSRSGR